MHFLALGDSPRISIRLLIQRLPGRGSLEVIFFAAAKSFDANIAIIGEKLE